LSVPIQVGRRLGACVEPLSRIRWRLRIRRHQTLPKSIRRKPWNSTNRLRFKAARQGFASVHQQAAEQLDRSPALIAIRQVQGPAGPRRGRAPARLPGLDRRLLVRADDEVARPGEPLGAFVEGQNRDGPFEEARIGGPLPAVVPPRLDAVGLEPALDGGA
jgi:hypothetical protein